MFTQPIGYTLTVNIIYSLGGFVIYAIQPTFNRNLLIINSCGHMQTGAIIVSIGKQFCLRQKILFPVAWHAYI